jgi:hypothetical protein
MGGKYVIQIRMLDATRLRPPWGIASCMSREVVLLLLLLLVYYIVIMIVYYYYYYIIINIIM